MDAKAIYESAMIYHPKASGNFIKLCEYALTWLKSVRNERGWVSAGAAPVPPSLGSRVKGLVHHVRETAIRMENVPLGGMAVTKEQVDALRDVATAELYVKSLQQWAKSLIEKAAAKPAQKELAPDGTEWAGSMSPEDWTKEAGCSLSTLKRWRTDGKLVVDVVTPKLWRISRGSLERCRRSKT
jgi:hypothetical protein